MQAAGGGGQYGSVIPSDHHHHVQQFMQVARSAAPPPPPAHVGSISAHMFSLSHDHVAAAAAPPLSHGLHSHQQQPQPLQGLQGAAPPPQQMMQVQQKQQLGVDPPSPGALAVSQFPGSYNRQLQVGGDEEGCMELEGERGSGGGNRWPRQETLALIKIRTDMDASFRDAGLKGPLWEEVSRKLGELGFQRSAKKCKEKFENVHKYYKKTKEGKAGRQDGKSYRFFSQLEALYGSTHAAAVSGHGAQLHLQPPLKAAGASAYISSVTGKFATGGGTGAAGAHVVSTQRSYGPDQDPDDEFNLSSESSEDDYDDPEKEEEDQDVRNKRKRKAAPSWSDSETSFFEGLMKKMLEKQEAMHRQFLEAMERREQERLVREDAWKRQEMARISREQELRAQERSLAATRDAALVSFLQKVTGQTLQLPHLPSPPPPPSNPHPPPQPAQSDDPADKETADPNSKRWPKSEVLCLIRLRSEMETKFQESGPKGSLWEAISLAMATQGYNRNPKRCKEKWENINKYFRKTKESSKKRPENAKTCPYFHQLDNLYRSGVLVSPSSKSLKVEDHHAGMDMQVGVSKGGDQDSGQQLAQDEEEEMVGGLIPSSGESVPSGSTMFSGQENGAMTDQAPTHQHPSVQDDGSGNFERFHEKSHPHPQPQPQQPQTQLMKQQGQQALAMEAVKEMLLEQEQKQLQQQSSEGYEMRSDQAAHAAHDSMNKPSRAADHQHWLQQQQQQQQQQDSLKLRSSSNRSNPKDVALIALVHKFAGQAQDYTSISD